jgi:hypothetical protein
MDWEMQTTSVDVVWVGRTASVCTGKMPLMIGCFDQLTNRHPQSHVYCAINGVEPLLRG